VHSRALLGNPGQIRAHHIDITLIYDMQCRA
jgi:hypothetical protein